MRGADLTAAHDVTLAPGERAPTPTGASVNIPAGYVGLIMPITHATFKPTDHHTATQCGTHGHGSTEESSVTAQQLG